jgi:hypothetical protein
MLRRLSVYAPDDVRKIKKLALGGIMTSITLAWRGPRIRIKVDGKGKGKWKKVWGWHVGMGFEALEEVWIGDSFEGGGLDVVGQEEARRHVSAAFQVEMRKWRREREFPRVSFVRGGEWGD